MIPQPRHLLHAALLLAAGPALADPQALSTNVPIQIEDAVPTGYGTMQLQFDNRFVRDRRGRGSFSLESSPVAKFGLLPGLQVDIGPSYTFGDKGSSNSGAGGVDALYRFNDETRILPALAVHAFYETPYGAGQKSAQVTVRGIATKSLGDSAAPRLHLNLTWSRAPQAGGTTRKEQLEIAGGASALLRPDTAVVVDVVHGAKAEKGANQTFLDVGLLHEINDVWSISGGAGAGIAQESPAFRVFFAVQRSFKLF